jgi:hypothetical protein
MKEKIKTNLDFSDLLIEIALFMTKLVSQVGGTESGRRVVTRSQTQRKVTETRA